MKRIYQAFWTKPMTERRLKFNVYIAALSLRYAQKSGYYVVMYTDTLGYSYLKDLGYDEINTYLDEIPEDVSPSQFFAYPKFFAGLKEPIGSLHIDYDVFLKQPCVDKFFEDKSIDIILQCREKYVQEFKLYVFGRKKIKTHDYPQTFHVDHMYSSNVGIIGFNNQELKDTYYSWYFDYINFYKDKLEYLQGVSSEMFAEQVNIDYLIKHSNYNPFYLLIDDDMTNHTQLDQYADEIGYQHLQGIGKYKDEQFWHLRRALSMRFPDTLKQLNEMFEKK